MAPCGRGATAYTSCWWSTRIQIGLSMNHTPEYLRGKGPDDCFRKNVLVMNNAGKKNKCNSHMMTVACGKPDSFLLVWVQDAT